MAYENDEDTTLGFEEEEPTDDEPGTPSPVPYSRFKEINDKLREAQEEGRKSRESQSHYESRIEALQEQADAREAEWQAWAAQVQAQDDDDEEPWRRSLKEQEKTIKSLKEQQDRIEMSRLETEIQKQMDAAKKEFPDMQEFQVAYEVNAAIGTTAGWQRYMKNPAEFIKEAAKKSHDSIQQLKDETIKDYVSGKRGSSRKGAEGGGGVPPSVFKGNAKSLEDAGKRAAARISAARD